MQQLASLSPSAVVSTGVLYSNVVPLGNLETLPMESLAFRLVACFIV